MSPDSFGVLQTDPEVLGVLHKICKTMLIKILKKRKEKICLKSKVITVRGKEVTLKMYCIRSHGFLAEHHNPPPVIK